MIVEYSKIEYKFNICFTEMKIIAYAFILVIWCSCNGSHQQIVVEKWNNGKVKVRLTFENSIDTSSYLREYFYENGSIGSKGKFIKGKQVGLWEWWYENGVKSDEAVLENGSYIGQRKHWFENGSLKQVEFISGNCLEECCDGKVVNYYENGQVKDESFLQNGLKSGKYIYKYDNGMVRKEVCFNEGVRDGKYYEWYGNGNKWVEGVYKSDQQDSVWTWYDTTGGVMSVNLYLNGKFVKAIK